MASCEGVCSIALCRISLADWGFGDTRMGTVRSTNRVWVIYMQLAEPCTCMLHCNEAHTQEAFGSVTPWARGPRASGQGPTASGPTTTSATA